MSLALVAGLGSLTACGDGGTTTTRTDGTVKASPGDGSAKTVEVSPGAHPGLPEDFPKDIPLIDEKVVNGVKGAEGGPFAWSLVMTSDRAVSDLSTEVLSRFSAAGYRVEQTHDLADVSIHQFSNATYDVGVTIARTGDGMTITYLVKNRS